MVLLHTIAHQSLNPWQQQWYIHKRHVLRARYYYAKCISNLSYSASASRQNIIE